MQQKGTLLIPSGPAHDPLRMHLHVVCSDPCAEGKQVIVSICSAFDACDNTCLLQAHEHEWLQHESFVYYASAQIVPLVALDRGVEQEIFKVKAAMNGQTFLRVLNGLCRSIHTKRSVKRYLNCPVPAANAA